MTYEVLFRESAEKEWIKLDANVRKQFAKKLKERAVCPHIPSAKLSGMPNCYKIKLTKIGYRLVYEVDDERIVVTVVAIGKRERGNVYDKAQERISNNT